MRISGAVVDGFTNGLRENWELREGYLHREDGKVRLNVEGVAGVRPAQVWGGGGGDSGHSLMWDLLEKKEEEKIFKKLYYGMI